MITVGTKVISSEHPKAIGQVIRQSAQGMTIEFTTPASANLPFGHVITEFWPLTDAQELTVVVA